MDCFRNSVGSVKKCLLDVVLVGGYTNSHRDSSMGRNPTDPSIPTRLSLCRLRSSLAKGLHWCRISSSWMSSVNGSGDGRWCHRTQHHHEEEGRAMTKDNNLRRSISMGSRQRHVACLRLFKKPASRINVASTMAATPDASGLRLNAVQCRFPSGRATWRPCTCTP